MLKILFALCLITNICLAQETLTFDSISVMKGDTVMMSLKCRSTLVYYPQGITLISDPKVYTYFIPGIEFLDFQAISFRDTGTSLSNDKSKPVAIYECTINNQTYKNLQVAQFIKDKGIALMKRNNSGILFHAPRLYTK